MINRILSFAVIFSALFSSTCWGVNIPEMKDTASVQIFPKSGKSENPLILSLKGKKYEESGLVLDNISGKNDVIVSFLKNAIDYAKSDKKSEYINLWQVKYKEDIEKFYREDEIWSKYHDLQNSIKEHRLVWVFSFGQYLIAVTINKQKNDKVFEEVFYLFFDGSKLSLTRDLSDESLLTSFIRRYINSSFKELSDFK